MFDGGVFGDRAPETPGAYSPTSPMSMDVLTEAKSDVAPILNMMAADDELCNALLTIDDEIICIVNQLGGNSRKYRRERGRQVRHLVSEVYSTARVTKVLKMLPQLDLTAGFEFDLTNED